ncbi:MAG: Fur family transcriptional regulator [Polyangiales bacterium]
MEPPNPGGEHLAAVIQAQLAQRGYRQTAQRRSILHAMSLCAGRFSTDELLDKARELSPRTGYATVNRMLRALVRCGLACARLSSDGLTRYELTLGVQPPHDYLCCDDCGLLIPFRDRAVEILQERIASSHGFRLETRVLELNGVCAACHERSYQESRATVA